MGFCVLWRALLGSIQVQGSYAGMGRRVDRGEDSRKGQRKEGFEGLLQDPGGGRITGSMGKLDWLWKLKIQIGPWKITASRGLGSDLFSKMKIKFSKHIVDILLFDHFKTGFLYIVSAGLELTVDQADSPDCCTKGLYNHALLLILVLRMSLTKYPRLNLSLQWSSYFSLLSTEIIWYRRNYC